MDPYLTSEQALLRDSAAKFSEAAGPKVARAFRAQDPSFSRARLRSAGELGWLSILVPESAGGLGLGLTELALVLQQAGRGLICEPIGLAAVSAAALGRGPTSHPMLERAMTGTALVIPAFQENAHGDDPLTPRTQAVERDGALRVTGTKTLVCADGADGFLVSASGPGGPALCYVDRHAPGCTLSTAQTVEGRKLATVALTDVPADLILPHASSRNAVDAVYNLVLMALSCELLGVMEKANDITLEYLRVRKQFGRLIGSFQALQHRAADILVRIETTRALVFQIAANTVASGIDSALAIALKAKASEEALAVTQACIQLHGAIGFTDEHDIGLYLKRAMLLSSLFGNAAAQRRRYVAITDLAG
jgi:alkylation response protein AidB-like acyl-CoA dehydrogenase